MKGDRFTRVASLVTKIVLVGGSVTLLGAACWQGVGTNTNVGNGNTSVNENANTVAGNVNAEVNGNVNVNSLGELDTSDWLVYTSPKYGFSVKYPKDWVVFNKIDFDNQGYLILDKENLSYLRFTAEENNPAPETGFQDITLGVFEEKDFDEDDVISATALIYKSEKYVILIDAATWAGDYELKVLNVMYKSITF